MSATPAKAKKAAKPRKVANHPKYIEMVSAAITSLKERGGSSRQAILKYIMAKYNVGAEAVLVNSHLKLALKRGVQTGALKQAKGTGAAGSFRVGEKKPAAKKAAQPKKAKSPKKVKAKKPTGEKKAAKPKKTKSPKKAKSPAKPKKAKAAPKKAKAAAKTKKPKTPKKKPAAKKSPKKAPKKAAKK